MKKEMLINVLQPEECRIAIVEDGVLEELYVERTSQETYVGNIYKGRIVNIEPSIQAAFVDFGIGRNGFLHVSDVDPAYYKHLIDAERLDRSERRDGGRRERRDRRERAPEPVVGIPELDDLPPAHPLPAVPLPPAEVKESHDDDAGSIWGPAAEILGEVPIAEPPIVGPADAVAPPEPVADADNLDPAGQGEPDAPRNRRGRGRGRGRSADAKEGRSRRRTRKADAPAGEPEALPPADAPNSPDDAPNSPDDRPRYMDSADRITDEGDDAPFGAGIFGDLSPTVEPPAPPSPPPPPAPPPEARAPVAPPEPEPEPAAIEREDAAFFDDEPPFDASLDEGLPEMTPLDELHPEMLGDDEFGEEQLFDMEGEDVTARPPRRERGDRGRDRDGRRGGPRGREGRDGRRGGPRGRDGGRPKPLIQDIFKRGQEVIVQVIKEGIGTKGPTLSTYISIAGRYLVLMPGLSRIGVSRKIQDEDARIRLREIMNELSPPKGVGFIVRTAGIDRNKKELQNDLAYLLRLWQVMVRRIRKQKSPAEIYQESDMITRTIRDTFTQDIDTIWVDEPNAFAHAQEFLQVVMPRFADRIKQYDDPRPLFHKYGIEDEITRIQQKKIPLSMGGSIVIEQTEALVAIDVNSGNFRADNNAEETAYQMNLQAAKEIARQLRLRDLGGVIVNDFIDMKEEKHRRAVERALRDSLKRDRARTKILKTSQFGLIEMTRQRIRPALKSSIYQVCTHCTGTGFVKTGESMSIEVMRLLQLAAHHDGVTRVQVRVHADVAAYLLNRKRKEIALLEEMKNVQVSVTGLIGVSPEFVEFICADRNNSEMRFPPPAPAPRQERERERGRDRRR
jgi:ribonuclease E